MWVGIGLDVGGSPDSSSVASAATAARTHAGIVEFLTRKETGPDGPDGHDRTAPKTKMCSAAFTALAHTTYGIPTLHGFGYKLNTNDWGFVSINTSAAYQNTTTPISLRTHFMCRNR